MYSVYCDEKCIYSDTSSDLSLKFLDAKLVLEDNAAGTFTFKVSPENVIYGKVKRMFSHIQVFRDSDKLWGGRAVSEEKDFWNCITYTCEGELAYLNDTYQPLDEYHGMSVRQFLECLLTVHNNKCNGTKLFTAAGNGPPTYSQGNSVGSIGGTDGSLFSAATIYTEGTTDPGGTFNPGDSGSGSGGSGAGYFDPGGRSIQFLENTYEGSDSNDIQLTRSGEYYSTSSAYATELNIFRSLGFSDIEDDVVNLRYNAVFSNVDMNNRRPIYWSSEMRDVYSTQITSWSDWNIENYIHNGWPMSVFAVVGRYGANEMPSTNGVMIAYTAIVETTNSARLIHADKIESYLHYIVGQSIHNNVLDRSELLNRDRQGYYIDNEFIHHIIIEISTSDNYDNSNAAYKASKLIRFVGTCGTLHFLRTNPALSGNTLTEVSTDHQDKRIYIGTVTVYDNLDTFGEGGGTGGETSAYSGTIEYRYTSYESTIEAIKKLVDDNGGHIRIRTDPATKKLYLDYLKDPINTSTQEIHFGRNLMDYVQNYDLSNLCTVLLPLGAKKNTSDLPGNVITGINWISRSVLGSNGKVYYGQYFNTSVDYCIERVHLGSYVDNVSGQLTNYDRKCYIKYTGTQIAGYPMYAFRDANNNFISVKTADNQGDTGYQTLNEFEITVPSTGSSTNYVYFVFSYYTGGDQAFPQGHCEFYWEEDGRDTVDTMYDQSNYTQIVTGTIINKSTGLREDVFDDKYMVSEPIPVVENTDYFYSARQNNGHGMYVVTGRNGSVLVNTKMASSGETPTTLDKEKISVPAAGAFIRLAAMQDESVPPTLYNDGKRENGYYDPPEDYVTVKDVNNGSLYVEDTALEETYGWIEKTIYWDDITKPADLLAKAQEYLRDSQYDKMTIEVTALDFHLLDAKVDGINLLDEVRCVSAPHNLDKRFPVTKIEIPLLEPENQKFTLGVSEDTSTISGSTAATDSKIFDMKTEQPKPSAILKSAKDNATQIINQKNNGYVVVNPEEILIMDKPDKGACRRLWRMNVNGIGYSSNGYYGSYDLAFTMDGAIVADRITTGFLHADRIRGGTLTLGGYDDVNGKFILRNAKGKTVVEMNKDESKFLGDFLTVHPLETNMHDEFNRYSTTQPLLYAYTEINDGKIVGGTVHLKVNTAEYIPTPGANQTTTTEDYWEDVAIGYEDILEFNPLTAIHMYDLVYKDPNNSSNNRYGMSINANRYFEIDFDGNYNAGFELCNERFILTTNQNKARISYWDIQPFSSTLNTTEPEKTAMINTFDIFSAENGGYGSTYDGHGISIRVPSGMILLDSVALWTSKGQDDYTDGSKNYHKAINGEFIMSQITSHTSSSIGVKNYSVKIVNGIIVEFEEYSSYDQSFVIGSSSGAGTFTPGEGGGSGGGDFTSG